MKTSMVTASARRGRKAGRVTCVDTADINWLNTGETARRLGITPRTLYRFIDDGKIPAYRFGRVIRLKESEVGQFIEQCRITPGTLDTSPLDEVETANDL